MKWIYQTPMRWVLAFVLVLSLNQCKEIGSGITLVDIKPLRDTTYIDLDIPSPQYRKVLFEEFTGVKCNNCPRGHETVKDIQDALKDTVIPVAIHNGHPLAKPFPGEQDFRTQEGIQISDQVGASSAIPVAAIDREQFIGLSQIALDRSYWINYTHQEKNKPVQVNVELSTSYDDASGKVLIYVDLHFLQDIDTATNLSIYVIESNIVSPQLLLDGHTVDSNYVHNHILRGFVNEGPFGKALTPSTEQGRVFEKDFAFVLPNNWNADNCEVIAVVHYHGGGSERVLQANSAQVK